MLYLNRCYIKLSLVNILEIFLCALRCSLKYYFSKGVYSFMLSTVPTYRPTYWLTPGVCTHLGWVDRLVYRLLQLTKLNSKKSVCVCVRVCLKYLCRSGSDWPEIFNMAAAWFKGVQCRICLDYNDTVNKWFHKWFTNSISIVRHSHVRTRANHCRAHPHPQPPESTDALLRPDHVTNWRWHSSKTQPPWVSVSTYACRCGLQSVYQFLNSIDRPSKTGLMINNVHHVFLRTLLLCLLCVSFRKKRSKRASLPKVSASRKCLQAKKLFCSLS